MLIISFSVLLGLHFGTATKRMQELAGLNIRQIFQTFGYPFEVHEVITDDGYILDLYRVPYGVRTPTNSANKNPALLHHGLLCSAENFIWMGPNKSLAFLLADNGYDVWMMNDRGTIHGRKHKTMNPDVDRAYWQYTWHEIGIYDIPATIDYILDTTKRQSLHYVGHSQGVISVVVMGSERPDYNRKLNVMIGLAPAVVFDHMSQQLFRYIAPMYKLIERIADLLRIDEIPPYALRPWLISIVTGICSYNAGPGSLCISILNIGGKLHPSQFDETMLPVILPTLLTGCSIKQVAHFGQVVATGTFAKFDWGPKENLRRYNNTSATNYNLKNVQFPAGLFFAETDSLIGVEDVATLASLLPNVVEFYKVPFKNFTHLDFLWSKQIYPLVNRRVLKVMSKFGYRR